MSGLKKGQRRLYNIFRLGYQEMEEKSFNQQSGFLHEICQLHNKQKLRAEKFISPNSSNCSSIAAVLKKILWSKLRCFRRKILEEIFSDNFLFELRFFFKFP